MRSRHVSAGLTAIVVLTFACVTQAQTVGLAKDFNLFDHVWNMDNGLQNGNAAQLCASTATVSSFVYMENQYPTVYVVNGNHLLTGDNAIATRNSLANGWNLGIPRPGMGGPATDQDWWQNKVWWIQDNAPNTTLFHGMVNANTNGWWDSGDLTQGYPTWQFLWNQFSACQDVELGIQPLQGARLSEGHALTLTSMHWDDLNGNNQWDPATEWGDIDYIDGNNPVAAFESPLSYNAGLGRLEFSWNNGGANPVTPVYMDLAYVESIPEPTALAIVVPLLALLLSRRTREGVV